jgi:hypothetical protein
MFQTASCSRTGETMKSRITPQPPVLMILFVFTMMFCGCEDTASKDSETVITPTRFHLDRVVGNYTATDEYTWETELSRPLVTIRLDRPQGTFNQYAPDWDGVVNLVVCDGRNNLVMQTSLDVGSDKYANDLDAFFQDRTTPGKPGSWRVIVGYNGFSGWVRITLE